MSIVLNEYSWAENAIRNKSLGKKPYETLSRIAKYYTYQSHTHKEVRRLLEEFLVQCEPNASVVSWSAILDSAAKSAQKYPLVMLDDIIITKPEIEKIKTLEGKQLRRLAFTLLCISKFMYSVSSDTNYWVSTPDNEIMNMANINTSIKRQSIMYGALRDAGMIRFSKKIDNLSVQVLFIEDGEDALRIKDFRNLGYQYMKYCGEKYFECANCGITGKMRNPSKGRKQKYCDECAKKVQIQQIVNSVMRRSKPITATDI